MTRKEEEKTKRKGEENKARSDNRRGQEEEWEVIENDKENK